MRTRLINRAKRAFTLIEILIVVVILGILAAIVIPQFTDASEEAMESSLRSQLQTIRAQIELWNVQNPADAINYDDDSPALATFWAQLVDNNMLQAEPRNPFAPAATATSVAGAAGLGVGWVWRDQDGAGPNTQYDLYGVDADGVEFVE